MTPLMRIVKYDMLLDEGMIPVDCMLYRLLMFWRATDHGLITIRDIHQELIPLKLNPVQQRVFAKMLDQAAQNKPIRLVVGKARKGGVSTLVQCLFVFMCQHFLNQQAVTIAHQAEATRDIFDIGRLAASRYQPVHGADVGMREIKWPTANSRYHCQTAGGVAVGAGGTPSLLHISELAKCERNKEETEYNSVTAVPDVPQSIIVKESTFMKRDLFWDRFEQAYDEDNPYDNIFIAWYVDDRLGIAIEGKFIPDEEERGLIAAAGKEGIELSFEALNWRRIKIKEIGPHVFKQEYPSTPEEAVQATKGLILPGLRSCILHALPFDRTSIPVEQRVGGIDFGFHDPTVIWSAYYVDQVIYLIDYYRRVKGLAVDHVKGLCSDHTYYCDPASTTSRQELNRAAIGCRCRFTRAPRRKYVGEDPSISELELLARLCRQGKVKILADCADQLLVEADSYAWNSTTGKPDDSRSESSGHFDSIMALKYLAMGVINRRPVNAVQKQHGQSRRSQFAGSFNT